MMSSVTTLYIFIFFALAFRAKCTGITSNGKVDSERGHSGIPIQEEDEIDDGNEGEGSYIPGGGKGPKIMVDGPINGGGKPDNPEPPFEPVGRHIGELYNYFWKNLNRLEYCYKMLISTVDNHKEAFPKTEIDYDRHYKSVAVMAEVNLAKHFPGWKEADIWSTVLEDLIFRALVDEKTCLPKELSADEIDAAMKKTLDKFTRLYSPEDKNKLVIVIGVACVTLERFADATVEKRIIVPDKDMKKLKEHIKENEKKYCISDDYPESGIFNVYSAIELMKADKFFQTYDRDDAHDFTSMYCHLKKCLRDTCPSKTSTTIIIVVASIVTIVILGVIITLVAYYIRKSKN